MSLEAGCWLITGDQVLPGALLLNTSGEMGCEAVTDGWWPLGPFCGLVPTGGSDSLPPTPRVQGGGAEGQESGGLRQESWSLERRV